LLDLPPPPRAAEDVRPDSAGKKSAPGAHLVAALETHVETVKAELEHRAAEIDTLKTQLADEAAKTGHAVAAVEAHNATLKVDIDKLEALHAAEQQRTDKAIAAFESLAQRLEEMAAQRGIKPWWQRLLRRAG
jgi:molecular chaperone GrpE (heat shock protein)